MSAVRAVDTGHPTATRVRVPGCHTIGRAKAPSAAWTTTAGHTTTCGSRTTTKLYGVANLEKGSSPRLRITPKLRGTTRSSAGAEVECSRSKRLRSASDFMDLARGFSADFGFQSRQQILAM